MTSVGWLIAYGAVTLCRVLETVLDSRDTHTDVVPVPLCSSFCALEPRCAFVLWLLNFHACMAALGAGHPFLRGLC